MAAELGRRQHIGTNAKGLAAPHFPGTSKAADYFVGNKQNIVLAQNLLNLFKISVWWQDRAASTHDGLISVFSRRSR
jgi:hypothetical protein